MSSAKGRSFAGVSTAFFKGGFMLLTYKLEPKLQSFSFKNMAFTNLKPISADLAVYLSSYKLIYIIDTATLFKYTLAT